ncbi:MAG TPA: cytochrome C oxidase subunit IV family protein [Thermoanaerobaculia bacterium]|jgi:cytochrome c oxidase subunit 4|nr:cytochrome C oxidase subunit IV family protein [Thermoanaerobaculia bacterium]
MSDHAMHPEQGVPDQHAGGAPREPLGEHEHPTHHDHGHDNSPEGIRKEIRRYLMVFGMLAVLTVITVAIAQLHLPTWQAVALALVVATVKATLVAAFFMHLVSEKKLIYAVLAITVFFFGVLMWGPWHHRDNAQKAYPGYDVNASQPSTTATAGSHDNQGQPQQGH